MFFPFQHGGECLNFFFVIFACAPLTHTHTVYAHTFVYMHGCNVLRRTALRFAEVSGHDEVACILRVDPSVSTIQESAAAGSVHEVWALMRQVCMRGRGRGGLGGVE